MMNQIRFLSESSPLKLAQLLRKPLLYSIGAALATLMGCSSSNTLIVDLPQPIYFGALPKTFPLDSSMVEPIKSLTATSSHMMEKEKAIKSGSGSTITNRGIDHTSGDLTAQIANALQDDPDLFIANFHMHALIEAYIPVSTIVSQVLAIIFFKQSESSDLGEGSSETIDISGEVYKRRNKR